MAPEGFVPYQQWPEYDLAADVPLLLAPRVIGTKPVGMYRRFWPLVVEEYISDDEPVMADSYREQNSLNRIIIWQRLFRTDLPPGWRRLSIKSPSLEGYAELRADYQSRWSESARRYRRKWKSEYLGKGFSVETVPADAFLAEYTKSDIQPYIKKLYAEIVARKHANNAPLTCTVARHSSGEVAAGMVVLTSASCAGSYYVCGFVAPPYEHAPAMVGLMDHWHETSLARGIRFLHFGRFWKQGEPNDWKGFSLFKSKFGITYISYPPPLWRFAKGKFF